MKGIKLKRITILLFVTMLLPLHSIAQNQASQGGLFGKGPGSGKLNSYERGGLFDPTGAGGYNLYNQQFGDNQYGGFNLHNQTFGQEVPLGSGLLILTTAGAGYALRKRKNNRNNQKS